ncbi:MAG: DMT family transporter [Absicoccus porci]|uniref:DMT family transporter n=1 Tax=Absicoccus porci TaxID=2486576 RepID=UPI00240937AA|nr:DMT family transporter [Absicoccus porci]MDD6459394.1 DMT family transporter [Absicoccus porci]
MNKTELTHIGILLITSIIWGMAFVAQSVGSHLVGPFTFMAIRSWLGFFVLAPLLLHTLRKVGINRDLVIGSICCGMGLFIGSILQQFGIAYTTTAKAGFITALYMIFVPICSWFLHKPIHKQIWISVLMSVLGLYLLCFHGSIAAFNQGDLLMLFAALGFTFQILAVNHFVTKCHPILLSGGQFLFCAIVSTLMMTTETITLPAFKQALIPMLYTGIFSTGVAYTLQIIGQKGLNPTVSSLVMCLESVFSALGGWLLLGQSLNIQELTGCSLMFLAIVFSQVSPRKKATD